MPVDTAQSPHPKPDFRSFLTAAFTLRYGVAAVIVISVVFALAHIGPMIQRDVDLLLKVHSVDQAGMALEGQLQYEIQAERHSFLRALLVANNPQEMNAELRTMHELDASIALTKTRITKLESVPGVNTARFDTHWAAYVSMRDRALANTSAGSFLQARQVNFETATAEFQAAEAAILDSGRAFESSSMAHLQTATDSLRGANGEVVLIIVTKVIALALLVWLDVRRVRLETQLTRATKSLAASEGRFLQAYESATVGMGMFRLDGTVLSVNQMGATILGYEPDELIGRKVSEFMAPECEEDHKLKIASLPRSAESNYRADRRVIRKDGTSAWVRNSVTLLKLEGEEAHYFSITEEVTEQKRANDRLAYLANFDPITDLMNRNSFEEKLEEALRETVGTTACVGLLYVEIDSFDFLNGTFGHAVSDEVLSELGASLTAFLHEGEVVARLDDHAFGMMFRAAPYDEATVTRGTELQGVFHRSGEMGKHRIPLSASIGVAYSSDETGGMPRLSGQGTEGVTLMKFARAAMLEARARGGDSIVVADPGLKQRAIQRHQIELALLNGLREEELRVVFQPQFEVDSGKLVRFEALCRWNSRELGQIPPDRFIPIAEQTGLIMEIGRRILFDALNQAKKWTDAGRRIGVAVNISPMQFMRPDFTNLITEVLAYTQFPPALLELEITEGIFIRDLNLAVARIRELQRLGLSIALDDFGTGYSSLSYLQKMPIDAVKLDRSFVSDLTTDPATVSMVRSVLAMAEALNLRVVTEGVETDQQLEILRALGCDEAQGYLLGRPEAAELALQRVLESPMYATEMATARLVQ